MAITLHREPSSFVRAFEVRAGGEPVGWLIAPVSGSWVLDLDGRPVEGFSRLRDARDAAADRLTNAHNAR